ncbi:MAG TPA: diguanylate cyclase [Xanthomonadales bacterium]|nr:diguanylate cyclase [Xanthomonadales bacterium]
MARSAFVLLLVLLLGACGHAPTDGFEVARLDDAHGPVDAADVAALPDSSFSAQQGDDAALLVAARTHQRWWRVRPTAAWPADSQARLVLYAPYTNRVTVVVPGMPTRTAGLRDADFDRSHSRHALVFELPAGWSPAQPVHVALEAGRRFPPRLAIEPLAEYEAGDVAYVRFVTALLAIVAVMCLVTGAFGLVLRERDFAVLSATLACELLWLTLLMGEAYDSPLGPWLAAVGVRSIWLVRCLGSAGLAWFAQSFMDLPLHAPRVARLLRGASVGFLVLAALVVLLPFEWQLPVVPYSGSVLVFLMGVVIAFGTVFALRGGSREARFFVAAWLPLVTLDVLRELQLLGVPGIFPGNEYWLPVATALAAGVFSFGLADRTLRVRHERDAARHAAERDPLTGVFNRGGIAARLVQACREAADGERHAALLYLDLDRFKSVNDTYGHALGDACLIAVTRVAATELRQRDSLGRYGGEEFLIVLPGSDAEEAERVAERIRAEIERNCAVVANEALDLTVSIGVAAAPGPVRSEQLLAAADAAMYAAKRSGRNCVRVGRVLAEDMVARDPRPV